MKRRIVAIMLAFLWCHAAVADTFASYTLCGSYESDESDGCAGLCFQTVAEQGETTPSYAVIGNVYPVRTCSSAKGDLVIPETLVGVPVRKIQAGAFIGNGQITSVVLPANLREIGARAFAWCTALTNVTCVGTGLADVGENCFSNCTSLAQVTFPDSLQRIGPNAFALCDNLAWVHFEGNAPILDGAPKDEQCSYFGEKRWTGGTAPARVLFYVNAGTYGWKGPYRSGIPEKWPLAYGYMNAHPVSVWLPPAEGLSIHVSRADDSLRGQTPLPRIPNFPLGT